MRPYWTAWHTRLRNVSIPSDECTLPSSLTLRQESLFLSTNNFFNFEYSGFNMGSGPTSPQEPLYHSEDEESLCPPGASVQKREPLSALYYFKTSQAPRLYKNS